MTGQHPSSSELLACCVELCGQVLHKPVQEVLTDASFFAQGGTSITLMQFAALLEAARPELFGPDGVDIVGLARAPTLADMPGAILQPQQPATTAAIEGEL
jgi:hypothetical protein